MGEYTEGVLQISRNLLVSLLLGLGRRNGKFLGRGLGKKQKNIQKIQRLAQAFSIQVAGSFRVFYSFFVPLPIRPTIMGSENKTVFFNTLAEFFSRGR